MAKKMQVIRMPVSRLKPHPENTRVHDEENISGIMRSLNKYGQRTPIVVWSKRNWVIKGCGTLEAIRRLGWTHVDVTRADELSGDEARAYSIDDNVTSDLSEFDDEVLRNTLMDLDKRGFDHTQMAMPDAMIEPLLQPDPKIKDGKTDPNAIPDLPKNPISKLGRVYRLGSHRLMCGTSSDLSHVMKLLRNAEITLVVTDPPYGVEYDPEWRASAGMTVNRKKMGKVQNDDRADWSVEIATFNPQVAYVWHAGKNGGQVQTGLENQGFEIVSQIIWVKDRFALSRGDYHWQHEPCFYAVRKGCKHNWQGARDQATTWQINRADDEGHGHGTQKPLECMERPILNNTDQDDLVADPFVGSGTTIIAAERTGRRCFAMELDPRYVDVARKRWAEFVYGEKCDWKAKTAPIAMKKKARRQRRR